MQTTSIESIISNFRAKYGIQLSKLPRKRIIYEGRLEGSSIVVVMPASTIYARGNGWVDFTKIQIDIFKEYKYVISIFRLSDGNTYYVDLNNLFPLLNGENMMVNDREGEHWKLDIWPEKIVIRNGGDTLYVKTNDKTSVRHILQPESV